MTQANPDIYLNPGETVTFNVNTTGHPFYIMNSDFVPGNGFVSANMIPNNTAVDNNGLTQGQINFTTYTPGTYYYQCEYHGSMYGQIIVQNTNIFNVGARRNAYLITGFDSLYRI